MQEVVTKTIPKKIKCKKENSLSEVVLQIAEEEENQKVKDEGTGILK